MKLARAAALSILALSYTGAANAAIILDGLYDTDYGASTASVTHNSTAAESNFGAPSNQTTGASYNIYLNNQGGYVYGLVQITGSAGSSAGTFANLYFDLDRANGNGSDLAFEITNDRAFVPGVPGYSGPLGLAFAASIDGTGLEFRIPDAMFTGPIAGLNYYPGQVFTAPGGDLVLRLSQSFGYSVAGGEGYGPDRLGAVSLGVSAVPGPMVGAGLPGLVMALGGLIAWRRRRSVAV